MACHTVNGSSTAANSRARVPRQRGFTYLGLLFAVAFIGAGLAVIGEVWSLTARRADEQELLFVGDSFRNAIASYYRAGPAGVQQYPLKLDDLLLDRRTGNATRHLRKIYADPITRQPDWELITLADGAIIGVASRSQRAPLKRARFPVADAEFEGAECYCDWRFVFLPQITSQNSSSAPRTTQRPRER